MPDSLPRTKNPLSTDRHLRNNAGEARRRLGLTDEDLKDVPKVTKVIVDGMGSVAEAIAILECDDSPDSIRFMEKWNSLSPTDQSYVKLEDVIIAAKLTPRRFTELVVGAAFDHNHATTRLFVAASRIRVLRSMVKAATDELPILDAQGNVIGRTNGDVRAMEAFTKVSGDMPTPKPSVYAPTQINIATTPAAPNPERTPLESMDSFLMELDEIRKPKQLAPPKEIIPDVIPDIEYLDDDLEGAHP